MTVLNTVTGTEPGLLHANGEWVHPNETWKRLKEQFFAAEPGTIGESSRVTVLTANNGAPAMGLFERGLRHCGIPYVAKGTSIRADHWVNALHKVRAILAGLEEVVTEYTLFADSRDCLLLVSPDELLERFFGGRGVALLFGAEMNDFPGIPSVRTWEDREGLRRGAGQFRYLNSGAWIGETEYAKEFFRAIDQAPECQEVPWSDQGKIRRYRSEHPEAPVGIDYRCELFQNNVNDRNQFLALVQ